MPYSKQQGFTLLEVLLATVILFTVLAVMTTVYRQAVLTSQKAEQRVAASSQVPFIIDTIAELIRNAEGQSQASGEGKLLGVSYHWQAQPVWRRHPTERPDTVSGEIRQPQRWFTLWQVTLTIQMQGAERSYNYQELSWSAN